MSRSVFLLLGFILTTAYTFGQKTNEPVHSNVKFAFHTGYLFSEPLNDKDYELGEGLIGGIRIENDFSKLLGWQAGLQYDFKGRRNVLLPDNKIVNHYINISTGLKLNIHKYYSFIGGINYGYNFRTYERIYNSFTKEYRSVLLKETNYSQLGIYAGTNLLLWKNMFVNIIASYPILDQHYATVQASIGFYLGRNRKTRTEKLSINNLFLKYDPKSFVFEEYEDPLSIEKITINNTNLTEIPSQIFEMKNLKILIIVKSKIKTIPAEIANLKKLEKVSFQFNEIDSISPEIGELEKLVSLNIQHNQLKKLPPEIGKLDSLQILYLDNNQLVEIPKEIGNLKNLRFLYIGKNSLNELPEELSDCEKLIELDVYKSGAMLKLPDGMNKLRKLEYMYVDENTQFPYSMFNTSPRLKVVRKSSKRTDLRL